MFVLKLRRKCILCNKYHKYSDMRFIYRGIGVCSSCYEGIITKGDKSFGATPPVDYIIAPFDYEGVMKNAVKKYKFAGQRAYGKLFGDMMCCELSGLEMFYGFDYVIPVPLHSSRLNERGYNQSDMLAEAVAKQYNVPYIDDALFRIRETKRQSGLKGMDRITNVQSAFYAAESVVAGKKIILVDDIYTMGQTMSACASALKDAGAERIVGVTLCKTPFKERKPFLR